MHITLITASCPSPGPGTHDPFSEAPGTRDSCISGNGPGAVGMEGDWRLSETHAKTEAKIQCHCLPYFVISVWGLGRVL